VKLPKFTNASKYEEARKLFLEGIPLKDVSKAVGTCNATVYRWTEDLRVQLKEPAGDDRQMTKKATTKPDEHGSETVEAQLRKQIEVLTLENSKLSGQLRYQTMRAEAFDCLINIAEKRHNIDIRKKTGTKQ
jgi:hypothetical protein